LQAQIKVENPWQRREGCMSQVIEEGGLYAKKWPVFVRSLIAQVSIISSGSGVEEV
jgi:hypothetical protein